jgi:sugar phosphate permease
MTEMANDFGSTTTAIGVISSSLFWCYAFGQFINGRLGAYFGHKKFMIIGIVMSAIMNILISYQNSILIISILWGLNGYCTLPYSQLNKIYEAWALIKY